MALSTLWFQISDLQHCDSTNVSCFKPSLYTLCLFNLYFILSAFLSLWPSPWWHLQVCLSPCSVDTFNLFFRGVSSVGEPIYWAVHFINFIYCVFFFNLESIFILSLTIFLILCVVSLSLIYTWSFNNDIIIRAFKFLGDLFLISPRSPVLLCII